MARRKSDEKRNDILAAAARVLAREGLAASTHAISKEARIGEGTLFIYFKTKKELLNALYKQIKLEMGDAIMSDYPRRAIVRQRLQHVWNHFVNWALAHRDERKAVLLLESSNELLPEVRKAGHTVFEEMHATAQDAVSQGLLRQMSLGFIIGTIQALAQNTMDFMIQHPNQADDYRRLGFDIFWAGIAKKKG